MGAQVVVGGRRAVNGECFVEPTVLTDVVPKMRVFREEIFGPVAPLIKFETEATSDRNGQRHRVRLGRVFLFAGHRTYLASSGGCGLWHRRD